MDKITIISHIYNEEYLLPFWLEHHSQIFDDGIIIDYCSTDKSIEIIKKFCPTWKIIKTKNLNEDGSPNFQALLVDDEIKEIEKNINGFKICLNTTEFFMINKPKTEFINSLLLNKYYYITSYSIMTSKEKSYPKNTIQFFEEIDLINNNCKISRPKPYRILHSEKYCDYSGGRHGRNNENIEDNIYETEIFILWCQYYPNNNKMIERKLQIQKNIPYIDRIQKHGIQHFINYEELINKYKRIKELIKPINDKKIKDTIIYNCNNLKKNNIYYSELFVDSNWGEDYVMLDNNINLLKNTDFDNLGYKIFNIDNFNDLLKDFIEKRIFFITNKNINLENYHNEINNEEHTKILNSMPYKKNINSEINEFCNYIEKKISEIVNENIKIFNDDIWIRICRPNNICDNDNNPYHKDVYLDFYKNIVNIYLPIIGSNEKSSLSIQPESHKWNENETMTTKGGGYFKSTNKKYSVDAIVSSIKTLKLIRPNPTENQLLLFSPYLIHGGASNLNENTTRISLEIRFIKNDEKGINQEIDFNNFLKNRNWR